MASRVEVRPREQLVTVSARAATDGVDRTLAWAALLAALALTLANAAKPIVIDDPVYVSVARQIEAHPSDPYGFELFWYDAPEPAMRVGTLAPVLPYWLAGAMALFGDEPVAWKLSLLPFALALTGSLAFLLARFARPLATPVLFTLALGPTLLPDFSLMLDVPAAALGLLGFALFVRACERERLALALAAGLVLGLAMQTKYSAVSYPALVLVLRRDLPAAARGGRRLPRRGGALRRLGGPARRALRAVALPRGHRARAHVEPAGAT